MYQPFNLAEVVWQTQVELNFAPETQRERCRYEACDGDGMVRLVADCHRENEEADWRWSRSDAWGYVSAEDSVGSGCQQ
jgi:hypothetical protein